VGRNHIGRGSQSKRWGRKKKGKKHPRETSISHDGPAPVKPCEGSKRILNEKGRQRRWVGSHNINDFPRKQIPTVSFGERRGVVRNLGKREGECYNG